MKGIVLCHGRFHRAIPKVFLENPDIEWLYVDIDPEAHPDLVMDYFDPNFIEIIGHDSIDVILTQGCPFPRMCSIISTLDVGYSLLKPGGIFYFNAMIGNLETIYRHNYEWREINPQPGDFRQRYRQEDPEILQFVNAYLELFRVETWYTSYMQVEGFPNMIAFIK